MYIKLFYLFLYTVITIEKKPNGNYIDLYKVLNAL